MLNLLKYFVSTWIPCIVLYSSVMCVVGFCSSNPALAWKQLKSEKTQKPLSWHKMPIQYAIDSKGLGEYFKNNPKLGAPGSEFAAIELSFKIWGGVFCPSGGQVGLTLQSLGLVAGKEVGVDVNCNNCNVNLVKFITDKQKWTRSTTELAAAIRTSRDLSGQIFDTDIVINAAHFQLSTQTTTPENVKWDIQNAVTHEVGHMLGLDHSNVPQATMYAQVREKVTSMRILHSDDVQGICTIYPPKSISGKVPKYKVLDRDRGLGGCSSLGEGMASFWALLALCIVFLRVRQRTA